MSNNLLLQTTENSQLQVELALQAEKFIQTLLAVDPPNDELKERSGMKYLPISYVETLLDERFFGLWEVKDFRYQVVANELIGSLQLRVYHPVFKQWIERTGAAAVQIQMRSIDKGGDGDITNVHNKITNTLEKDFPHLKADCVKNAAKSLGKVFTRDLNRKHVDVYQPVSEQLTYSELANELKPKLAQCNSLTELGMLFEMLDEDQKKSTLITKLFTVKKTKLRANGK